MASRDDSYLFGPYRLSPSKRQLLKSGDPVRIGSRAFDILLVLLENAGRVVPAPELIAQVWPRTVVDPAALRVHLATLRKALGDRQGEDRYIENVPGQGYALVAPVHIDATGEAMPVPVTSPAFVGADLPNSAGTPQPRGRDDVILELADLLSTRRVVTIVGPAGIGKTSVASALSRHLLRRGEEVAFIELASLRGAERIPSAVAMAVGVAPDPAHELPSLVQQLQGRRLTIVLDNCEHVIGGVADSVDALLLGAPEVRIVATSREPLRVNGEWVHRLNALRFPPATPPTIEEALGFDAVALFVERARVVNADFLMTEAQLDPVCEICRRLDGNPLALELAAARVDTLDVEAIREGLGDRWSLLAAARRGALPHHQSLRAALDWSFELLSQPERFVLARVSIFQASFDAEGAIAVCGEAGDLDVPPDEIEQALFNLVAKSMLAIVRGGDRLGYRLLESTRDYAKTKLSLRAEGRVVGRLLAHYLGACFDPPHRADPSLESPRAWIHHCARHIDDLRGALRWAFSPLGDVAVATELVMRSIPAWLALSLIGEGLSFAELARERFRGVAAGDPAHRSLLEQIAEDFQKMLVASEAHAIEEIGRKIMDAVDRHFSTTRVPRVDRG